MNVAGLSAISTQPVFPGPTPQTGAGADAGE